MAQNRQGDVDANTFNALYNNNPNAVLLDVRSEQEFAGGHIKGAENYNYNAPDFSNRIQMLDKSKTYFVYCLSGSRSASAITMLRTNGIIRVYQLKGGLLAWQHEGLPLEGVPSQENALNDHIYDSLINVSDYVMIDFYAPWCGPCKKIEPVVNEIAERYRGKVAVFRVNIDYNKEMTQKLGVLEIPLIKIYKKGKIINNYIGVIGKEELESNFRK